LLLEQFIQDILTISRLDYSPQLAHEPLDLNSLLSDSEQQLRETARKKNITIELQLQPSLPPISGNATELHRAFTNIVENALKYTLDEGSVIVQTRLQDQGIAIVISDTGIGIGEADLPYVFDRFYRTDKARGMDKGGTGLGLAIVKKVVEMHGGTVDVESVLGEGSTFRVWLPAAQATTHSESD
jgi:two-component system phosphate regulon sensor histidine kinase PhoR